MGEASPPPYRPADRRLRDEWSEEGFRAIPTSDPPGFIQLAIKDEQTEQVQAAAADMPEDSDERLGQLDDEFFAYPDPIAERLLAFIRGNAAAIRLRSLPSGVIRERWRRRDRRADFTRSGHA